MRTSRTMLATAAATAVLAIGAPGAYAAGGDWSNDDSSYSTDQSWGGSHDGPHGGMHTGGGALSLRTADSGKDWGSGSDSSSSGSGKDSSGWSKESGGGKESGSSKESDGGKESGWTKDKDSESSSSGDHEKPHGGMHTGGGALAAPSTTAGGVAVLALVGAGLYAARRKKSAPGLA
ncbi:hypothetical protein [Streptomyces sp. NPDC047000]|uniref:hypothetical protein n=1 Tax=Streptomyces sp. NPDC047000 TaxID=3155474 RepID=UPI00340239C3